MRNLCAFSAYLSINGRKNIKEALEVADRIVTMQYELHQFEMYKVLPLEPQSKDRTIIRTRLIIINKLDDQANSQGYNNSSVEVYQETAQMV